MPEITFMDTNGNTVEAPAFYEVCPRCDGEGVHDHPAFNGFSSEDFAEDPEFAESYFDGHYDVLCTVCKGLRVVPVLDEEKAGTEVTAEYYMVLQAEADYRAEVEAERRMGA